MKSTFDDRLLKSISNIDYSKEWFPLKTEIEAIFSKYGYTNLELAYLCSFASKKDIEAFFPRYKSFYNLMVLIAKFKCPQLYKKDSPAYIDGKTRKDILTFLEGKVKAEYGKFASDNYPYLKCYVYQRAAELGWNPIELTNLVEKEMVHANGSELYAYLDAIHKDDIGQAAERAIQYVEERYDKIEMNNDYVPSGVVKNGFVQFPFFGALEVIDAVLYNGCSYLFDMEDVSPSDLKDDVLPKLERIFKERVTSNPLLDMMSQYRCIFDTTNDDNARRYYDMLRSHYNELSFTDYDNPSPYVAAQYLYSMITRKPVRDKLPIVVGSLICELLVLFGYITIGYLDVYSQKDKYDAVKRFLEVDKKTGLYKRLE